jgi:hypothetical protein
METDSSDPSDQLYKARLGCQSSADQDYGLMKEALRLVNIGSPKIVQTAWGRTCPQELGQQNGSTPRDIFPSIPATQSDRGNPQQR